MNPYQTPRSRPRPSGLATSEEGRRIRRNRAIAMVLIMLVGIAIIVWDFLRPARSTTPADATQPADGRR